MIKTILLAAVFAVFAVLPAHAAGGQTDLKIYNPSNNPVTVYIELNPAAGPNPGFIQDVQLIPTKPVTAISGTGLAGSFTLANGKMVSIKTAVGQSISGKISFVTPPGSTVNEANVTLNNNTAAYGAGVTEFAGIDTTSGLNSRMKFDFTQTSGTLPWKNGTTTVTTFENNYSGVVTPVPSAGRPAATGSGGTAMLSFKGAVN